ncbi:hypothetical protein B0H19DRAFT_1200771 [Mycena capillaripes]|nr:hypothetical protein B0H19DRAFT_1200771 [Mycena capillaripes]
MILPGGFYSETKKVTALMANGLALVPGPSDNHRFVFEAETAKETLTRMFGQK